ncbi:hypothetical protein T12_13847 [Trichinella patagoniensis]|uniref:Uncharacterized protein n=1 Tax=Trichinella patagoniensis TaxID=990121 RepID=A0A0V1A295_9BILA|nr:hypothetical protein T12_13847 [Trichinella patagoniensis]
MTQHAKADNNDMNIRTVAAVVDIGLADGLIVNSAWISIHRAEENDHKWVIVLVPFTRSSCHAQLSSFLSKNNNGYGKLIQTNMLKNVIRKQRSSSSSLLCSLSSMSMLLLVTYMMQKRTRQ